MKVIIVSILFSLNSICLFGQKPSSLTLAIFQHADSVLLISHDDINGGTDIFIGDKGERVDLPELLVNGRLNYVIIKEKRILLRPQIDSLVTILMRPFSDSIIQQGGCYTPHHAIIIINNNKASYIDICFHCSSYRTSRDLRSLEYFDDQRWQDLLNLFKRFGFNYAMEGL